MIINPDLIIGGFISALKIAFGLRMEPHEIIHERLLAPHRYPDLPSGKSAVYVFSLTDKSRTLAGPNRVLKVGRAGINSQQRFKFQHYKLGSAKSTLAGAVKNNRILYSYIGYDTSLENLDSWLRSNTDRDHFFLNPDRQNMLPLLEVYVRGILGPVYEGSLTGE